MAYFELAFARLPRLAQQQDAFALFCADRLIERGISPRWLMRYRGIDTDQLDLQKYNPTEPRVPAGHGRQSGWWTSEGPAGEAGKPIVLAGGPTDRLVPDPNATGPHTTFRRGPTDAIEHYQTHDFNERTGKYEPVLRYRATGRRHGGVEPPLILEPRRGSGIGSRPNRARPALPFEIPGGGGGDFFPRQPRRLIPKA